MQMVVLNKCTFCLMYLAFTSLIFNKMLKPLLAGAYFSVIINEHLVQSVAK